MLSVITKVFCVFILGLVIITAGCGRRKTAVSPPIVPTPAAASQPETLFKQGLSAFHLGTPDGYTRAADSFRKAWAQNPDSCEYPLSLAQSLLFLATEQLLNWDEFEPRQAEARSVVDSAGE